MKILVVMPVNEQHKKQLISKAPDAEWIFTTSEAVSEEVANSAEVIIGNIPPQMIAHSPNLKWLQLNSAGMNGYIEKGALPEGVKLTNATGAYGLAISEHMMASLLFLMKRIGQYYDSSKSHDWIDFGPVRSVYGSKTLVVGCGNIGCDFAKRMNAFGSKVIGIKRHIEDVPNYIEEMYTMDALDDCLKDADIVATCLPGSPEVYRLFDEKRFAAMKKGAYFLNVGRGSVVDSDALCDALNSGHLAGAAVDVTDPEPLPKAHPLWDAGNILITPHISGGYHLQYTHDMIVKIAADRLGEYIKN